MMFWPGLDQWPPSKRVWGLAVFLTFVVTPIAILIGTVGFIILGVIVAVSLWVGANARLKKLNAEEFWDSGPDE
jgi:hypothetical protein